MIDRRRCPSRSGTPGERSSNPSASGPRWPMRSVISRTGWAPSGWQNAPATPHMSASHLRLDLLGGSGGAPDERVIDRDIGVSLVRPAELLLDPQAPFSTHLRALVVVVEKFDNCSGIRRHVAA